MRQYSVCSNPAARSVSTGNKSTPSSGQPGAGATPAAARQVAVKSIVMVTWSVMRPGSIRSDQRQICGTLNPPSNRSNFRPTNGQIFGKSLAAVVAGEHDERVVVARSLPYCVKHAADAGIQGLHHFAIDADVAAFGQFS